jgi:hypothetical protein
MNRDTFPGMLPYARTYATWSFPGGASMLADDIADRIALARHPAEIDEMVKRGSRRLY